MKEIQDVLRLDLFKWRIGGHINDSALGVQLSNGVFANIDSLSERFVWNDLIKLRVDRDPNLEILGCPFIFFGLHLHLAADAAALPIGFSFLRFLNCRYAQD